MSHARRNKPEFNFWTNIMSDSDNKQSSSLFSDAPKTNKAAETAIAAETKKRAVKILLAVLAIAVCIGAYFAYGKYQEYRYEKFHKAEMERLQSLQNGVPRHEIKMTIWVKRDRGIDVPEELRQIISVAKHSLPSEINYRVKLLPPKPDHDDSPASIWLEIGANKMRYDNDLEAAKQFINKCHAEIYGDVLRPLDVQFDGYELEHRIKQQEIANADYQEYQEKQAEKEENIKNSPTWKMNAFDAGDLPLLN